MNKWGSKTESAIESSFDSFLSQKSRAKVVCRKRINGGHSWGIYDHDIARFQRTVWFNLVFVLTDTFEVAL